MFNRNFMLILLTNVILGAPMPMLIILGSLAGAALAPADALITVPVSIQMLAGILIASPLSLFMGRVGRRIGFLVVAFMTTLGASMAVLSLYMSSFVGLCIAHLLMGAALIGVNFLRFVAAEVVPESSRPTAISFTLASGIVAALLGPSLFDVTKDVFAPVSFAGAYGAIAVLGIAGALPILLMLLPEVSANDRQASGRRVSVFSLLKTQPALRMAMGVAAAAQGVMVLLMVPTPHAMIEHGFDQSVASDVIRWHVVAMFAPGLFTGAIIRRLGVHRVMVCGLLLLIGAGAIAVSGTGGHHFYLSLFLLGVGWNFGFIGGTHLLQASTTAADKPAVQGFNDTLIAVASVSASVMSGVLYVGVGWAASSMLVMPLLLLVVVWLVVERRRAGGVTA